MTKREWKRQLFFAITLTLISLAAFVAPSSRNAGAVILIIPALAAHSWYQVIRWAPKSKR